MNPVEILARTLWSEDRGGGADGMKPIAGVVLTRASSPGWWGSSITTVCLAPGQFSGWWWKDPNFIKLLTVDIEDEAFKIALGIATEAVDSGMAQLVGEADHYYAKTLPTPAWAKGKLPVHETPHHYFFKLGLGG